MEKKVENPQLVKVLCFWCDKVLDFHWRAGAIIVTPCENCASSRGTKEETMDINLDKYNKADVLAALYNNSQPLGLGHLHYNPAKMTRAQAEELLDDQTYFDYLLGRVMKIDLSGSTLNPVFYDRDNGQGAAQAAINSIQV